MIIDPEILHAIDKYAKDIQIPAWSTLQAKPLMAAITWPETSWGERRYAALFEPAYYRGGKFYKEHVKTLVQQYESLASCSYGPWQILFVAAYETGFKGRPWDLIDPYISAEAVVRLLNKRCFNTWANAPDPKLAEPASTPEQAFDFWNSGSWRDRFIPGDYVATGLAGYAEAVEYYSSIERPPQSA